MKHEGKIILQSVTKFSRGQLAVIGIHSEMKICEILSMDEDTILITLEDSEFTVYPEELKRLVISNGEKIAPLQHSDWPRVIQEGGVLSEIVYTYYLVEKRSKGSDRPILLAKLTGSEEYEKKQLAKRAFYEGRATSHEENAESTFEFFWKNTK